MKIINQIPFDYEDYCTLKDIVFFEILEVKDKIRNSDIYDGNFYDTTCLKIILLKLEKVFSKLEEYREYFH